MKHIPFITWLITTERQEPTREDYEEYGFDDESYDDFMKRTYEAECESSELEPNYEEEFKDLIHEARAEGEGAESSEQPSEARG